MANIRTQVPFALINIPFGGLGVGNVYYVVPDDAYSSQFIADNNIDYSDGSHSVFQATMASASVAIQAALDACVANRNDYVLVMPSASTYTLTAVLTMSKKNVHLIAPGGLGRTNGANNSTRVQAAAASNWVEISAASCEVAGFYIKNIAGYSAIYLYGSSTAVAPFIHHNTFFVTCLGSANLPVIRGATDSDGGWFGAIEDNHILTYGTASATMTSVIYLGSPAGMAEVNRNHIGIAGCTVATGINVTGNGSEVCDNYIYEIGVGAGSTAGVLTIGIQVSGAVSVINNRIGMATTDYIAGAGNYYAIGNVGGLAGTTAWMA